MYSQWLQGLVSGDERLGRRYAKLLKTLAAKEFTYFIPNDDNRAGDGIKLRTVFLNALPHIPRDKIEISVLSGNCSILEMMVALAIRFDESLISGDSDTKMAEFFWEFVHNLGLGVYPDDAFNSERVEDILETLLARKYGRNGKGGMFPLRRPRKDARTTELWYQMMAYLDENYEI